MSMGQRLLDKKSISDISIKDWDLHMKCYLPCSLDWVFSAMLVQSHVLEPYLQPSGMDVVHNVTTLDGENNENLKEIRQGNHS